ncbi:hypothetical protein CDAR_574441 [Caerostris darwini]|uniref:Uncharacterized protein n=1 Tax=Caerostris darwini TaxID=1538125 RepID=A0AAV4UIB4_9ARAC|nr:hypothetical protein CDAR_574441 [Caerostris darwini]
MFWDKRKRGHKKTLRRIFFVNVNNLEQHSEVFPIFEYLLRNPLHFELFHFLRIFRAFGLKIHIHVLPAPQTEIFSGIKRDTLKKGKEAYASYICMRAFLGRGAYVALYPSSARSFYDACPLSKKVLSFPVTFAF